MAGNSPGVALSDGLGNREVREIKGGSHMLLLEHPEEVAKAIRDFIQRHVKVAAPSR